MELTPNETEIIISLRQMQAYEKMIILKNPEHSAAEYKISFEKSKFLKRIEKTLSIQK